MREIRELLVNKVKELLDNGTVDRVIGWKAGEFCYDVTPAVYRKDDNFDDFLFDGFCGANQSKYLIEQTKGGDENTGKILALLKPCDSYSFNQLIKEHRIDRDKVYILGIPCEGMLDVNKLKANDITGILSIEEDGDKVKVDTLYGQSEVNRKDVLLERCYCCKGSKHMVYDELLDESAEDKELNASDRFAKVAELESMNAQEKFDFWRSQLSKCIRCNACRNVCPACSCRTCVFDNPKSGVSAKVNTDTFEENMFHIIRAWHVAGRCTDCGECSRVCPQNIPLHLLNRKFIKDMNELYGEFQAGEDDETKGPLTAFTKEDVEPSIVYSRGGEK